MTIRQHINNANTIKNFKGQHIIGSIDKVTGAMSISAHPVPHATQQQVQAEAARLAKTDPTKKYVALTIGAITSVQDVIVE
jgi:hypothetical protein